jgi:hypothetical protein
MRVWVACLAVGAVVSACGGDGGDGQRDSETTEGREYVEAIMAGHLNDEPRPDEGQSRCAAERWVDAVGVETFEAADVTPEDVRAAAEEDVDFMHLIELTDAQGGEIADIMIDCIDMAGLMVESMSASPDFPDLPADQLACVATEMERTEAFRELMKAGVLGQEQDPADVQGMLARSFDSCDVDLSELLGS